MSKTMRFKEEEILVLEADSIEGMMDKLEGMKDAIVVTFPASPELLAGWEHPTAPGEAGEATSLSVDFTASPNLYWLDGFAVREMERLGEGVVVGTPINNLLTRFESRNRSRVAQTVWALKLLGCVHHPEVGCYTQPYSECHQATVFVKDGNTQVSCLDYLKTRAPRVYAAVTSGLYRYRQYVTYSRPQMDVEEVADR